MAKNVFVFPDTARRDIDVIVAVPKEHKINGNKYPIIVKEKKLGKDELGNALVPPRKRLIINFAIYYVTETEHVLLENIRPHFEVWVGYKKGEEGDELAYYDRTKAVADRWVDMKADKAKSPHLLKPDGQYKYKGYGYVKRSKWGDPNLGWG